MAESLHVKISGPIATLTLSRPQARNALDEQMAGLLTQAVQKIGVADLVRVVVIEAADPGFCAGIDPLWLTAEDGEDPAGVQRDAAQAAMLLDAVDRCPKPVIAVVNGPALGLGVGLVAAADMAIASEEASFALPEVRLGLSPSLIAPYLAAAMGARSLRRYGLSGERFDAREALRLGLVHGVVAPAALAAARDHLVEACLKGAPKAQGSIKDMLRVVTHSPLDPDLLRYAAGHFAELRRAGEAAQGLEAARDQRPPPWAE